MCDFEVKIERIKSGVYIGVSAVNFWIFFYFCWARILRERGETVSASASGIFILCISCARAVSTIKETGKNKFILFLYFLATKKDGEN